MIFLLAVLLDQLAVLVLGMVRSVRLMYRW